MMHKPVPAPVFGHVEPCRHPNPPVQCCPGDKHSRLVCDDCGAFMDKRETR